MFDQITALGYGVVIFAVVIVTGTVILHNFGGANACGEFGSTTYTWNTTSNLCYENANTSNIVTPTGAAYTNINYLSTQLGSGGLAGWTPAVIAIAVGLLFLGAFMIGKGRKTGRY